MNIASITHGSEIYGPGLRTVIWVQGCSIRCKGCWNKSMWSFKSNEILGPVGIVDDIMEHQSDGVTILGGEPFDQFDELVALVAEIKRRLDIGIIVYTGYSDDDDAFYKRCMILEAVGLDVLIAGRYDESLRDISSGIIGSTNQEVIHFTDLHRDDNFGCGEVVEIDIDSFGAVEVRGYPIEELTNMTIL